ncbi:MAG TPA: hypothetical protein VIL37_09435 [Natronosporangium sp.]
MTALLEWLIPAAGIAFLLWYPAAFAYSATAVGRRGGAKDRLALFVAAAGAGFGLAFGRSFGPWDLIPPALWAIPAALTAWGVLASIWQWPALPVVVGRRPRLRIATTVAGITTVVLLIVLIV